MRDRSVTSLVRHRRRTLIARAVLVAGLCIPLAGVCGLSSPAAAQSDPAASKNIIVAQNNTGTGFNPFRALQRIFRSGERRKAQQPTRQTQTARPVSRAPAFEEVPKDPEAGLILVVGDRMARGVAEGLKFTLKDQPRIRVEPITVDKAGFAGAEPPDWTARTLAKIRGADVKAVVVMMGQHDVDKAFPARRPAPAQGLEDPQGTETVFEPEIEYMTSEWLAAYNRAAETLVRAVRAERKPVVWVGLPPTNGGALNGDFTQFNFIFEGLAEQRRVRYVDIWDIFLSEDGSFSSYGPDVDGRNVRLRTADRIGFTWAGYRKVAFFVERELSRLLGGYGGLAFEGVEDDPNFMVLTGRTTSPEIFLLGSEDDAEIDPDSAAYRLFVEGQPVPSLAGRVDDPRQRSAADISAVLD